jgi:hypothetical protein
MRQRCESEKTSSPTNQKLFNSFCVQYERLKRHKAYQDRGEEPPLEDGDPFYRQDSTGRENCYYKNNGKVLPCPRFRPDT